MSSSEEESESDENDELTEKVAPVANGKVNGTPKVNGKATPAKAPVANEESSDDEDDSSE